MATQTTKDSAAANRWGSLLQIALLARDELKKGGAPDVAWLLREVLDELEKAAGGELPRGLLTAMIGRLDVDRKTFWNWRQGTHGVTRRARRPVLDALVEYLRKDPAVLLGAE